MCKKEKTHLWLWEKDAKQSKKWEKHTETESERNGHISLQFQAAHLFNYFKLSSRKWAIIVVPKKIYPPSVISFTLFNLSVYFFRVVFFSSCLEIINFFFFAIVYIYRQCLCEWFGFIHLHENQLWKRRMASVYAHPYTQTHKHTPTKLQRDVYE